MYFVLYFAIMKYKEYLKMKEKIEEEYHEQVNALELLWKKHGDKSTISESAKSARRPYGQLITSILQIAEDMGHEFTLKEISERLKGILPDCRITSVSVALKRLVDKGLIIETMKGSGRHNPTKFSVPKSNKKGQHQDEKEVPF